MVWTDTNDEGTEVPKIKLEAVRHHIEVACCANGIKPELLGHPTDSEELVNAFTGKEQTYVQYFLWFK